MQMFFFFLLWPCEKLATGAGCSPIFALRHLRLAIPKTCNRECKRGDNRKLIEIDNFLII